MHEIAIQIVKQIEKKSKRERSHPEQPNIGIKHY